MYQKIIGNLKRLLLLSAVLASGNLFAAPEVRLSAIALSPGQTGDLVLEIINNTNAVAMEIDITLDESQFTIGTLANGVDLNDTHTIDSNIISPSWLKILVYLDLTNTVLNNGSLISLPITLNEAASSGNKSITINNLILADATANSVPVNRIIDGLIVDSTDAVTDSDNDGIPDAYEVANNLHPLDDLDAALDSDSDGSTNLEEYLNGTDVLAPTIPSNLIAEIQSGTETQVSWTASTDQGNGSVAGYEIYRDGEFVIATTATSYLDSNLTIGIEYSYAVLAYDDATPANKSNLTAEVSIIPRTSPLKVSSNGRYFVKGNDTQPFFWLADTAWAIAGMKKESDLGTANTVDSVDDYLEARANQGFSVIQGPIIVGTSTFADFTILSDSLSSNAYGIEPFSFLSLY